MEKHNRQQRCKPHDNRNRMAHATANNSNDLWLWWQCVVHMQHTVARAIHRGEASEVEQLLTNNTAEARLGSSWWNPLWQPSPHRPITTTQNTSGNIIVHGQYYVQQQKHKVFQYELMLASAGDRIWIVRNCSLHWSTLVSENDKNLGSSGQTKRWMASNERKSANAKQSAMWRRSATKGQKSPTGLEWERKRFVETQGYTAHLQFILDTYKQTQVKYK